MDKIPNNQLGWCWNPINNGINYQINWCRILFINSMGIFWGDFLFHALFGVVIMTTGFFVFQPLFFVISVTLFEKTLIFQDSIFSLPPFGIPTKTLWAEDPLQTSPCIHLARLTWNLRINPWKRRNIFQTIIFRFYVNLGGCSIKGIEEEPLTVTPSNEKVIPLPIDAIDGGRQWLNPYFF